MLAQQWLPAVCDDARVSRGARALAGHIAVDGSRTKANLRPWYRDQRDLARRLGHTRDWIRGYQDELIDLGWLTPATLAEKHAHRITGHMKACWLTSGAET